MIRVKNNYTGQIFEGCTQKEVAEKMGINFSHLNKIINGIEYSYKYTILEKIRESKNLKNKSEENILFSRRLKEAMSNKNTNVKKMASDLSIKKGTLYNYLKAGNLPPSSTLIVLCRYLDCSADYLLGLEDNLGGK